MRASVLSPECLQCLSFFMCKGQQGGATFLLAEGPSEECFSSPFPGLVPYFSWLFCKFLV
jgi:hypothetical protein